MTFQSLRSTWTAIVLGFITAVLLSSCGGGGAAATTTGGALQVLAPNSMYGGVPADITIVGGRTPYILVSSEPSVISLPQQTTSSTITVLPANPGVIDANLPPGSLPVRTVNITVRDANGNTATTSTKVGQNFLTGYGVTFGATTCTSTTAGGSAASAAPCAGGDTLVTFQAVTDGQLYGGREFRLDVMRGPITLVNPATGASGTSIGVTSDHAGNVQAIIRGNVGAPTQIATIRITDVATGVQTFENFILQGPSSKTTLTALPSSFTFTGKDTSTCGTGSGQFLVFDGTPPYTAVSSDPNVTVTYIDPYHNPGIFGISATNSSVCVTNGTVIVTDVANARTTVTVTTNKGTTPPVVPPTPLQVQPSSITLSCGQTGSVTAIGGGTSSGSGSGGSGSSGVTYSASAASPNITTAVSGGTISITAFRGAAPGAGTGTTTYTVNVSDGTSIVPVSVTAPVTCP